MQGESVGESVGASVGDSVGDSVEDSVGNCASVGNSVCDSGDDSIGDSVGVSVDAWVGNSVCDSGGDFVGNLRGGEKGRYAIFDLTSSKPPSPRGPCRKTCPSANSARFFHICNCYHTGGTHHDPPWVYHSPPPLPLLFPINYVRCVLPASFALEDSICRDYSGCPFLFA